MTREQLEALALLLGLVVVAALADIVLVVVDDHVGGGHWLKHPVAILVATALAVVATVGLFLGLFLSRR